MNAVAAMPAAGTRADGAQPAPFDFRNPGTIARDQVRRIELLHEVFARAFGNALSGSLRTLARVELMSIDQITYDEYVRSAPNPTVLTTFNLSPLPGTCILEMSTQMGLNLVDRLLGGTGKSVHIRRPTSLETTLLLDLMGLSIEPLIATFEPILDVDPEIKQIEYNPHFVQAGNPSDMVTVLSFTLAVMQGERTEGLMTMCFPAQFMEALDEAAEARAAEPPLALGSGGESPPLLERMAEIEIPISVQLEPATATTGELRNLRVGDVLRLDHEVDQPALGVVEQKRIFEGRVGRKGKSLALEITNWRRV